MWTFLAAATGLPTILLTAALVVVVCFWLLAAVGVADVDSFDADMDLRGWRMGGVPVAVALSLLTAFAWSLSVGAALVLAVFAPAGPAVGLLRLVVPAGAMFVAWAATCLIVRALHRLFPDEPGLSAPSEARTRDATVLRAVGSRDPSEGVPRDASPHLRDHAA